MADEVLWEPSGCRRVKPWRECLFRPGQSPKKTRRCPRSLPTWLKYMCVCTDTKRISSSAWGQKWGRAAVKDGVSCSNGTSEPSPEPRPSGWWADPEFMVLPACGYRNQSFSKKTSLIPNWAVNSQLKINKQKRGKPPWWRVSKNTKQ